MRWVFALLIIGNGIYFCFQVYMVQPIERQAVTNTVELDLGAAVVLLSEALPATILESSAVAGLDAIPVVDDNPMCWLLGPFKESISAKQMVGRLSALEITFEMKEYEVEGPPDYWVHILPLSSRKLATKQLRDLQRKNIDSFLITEGELRNGISLGLFTEKLRAEALYDIRAKEGLNINLKEVPRIYREIWLVSDRRQYLKFSDQLWDKIKEGHSGIERRKNYCNKIASLENLD